MIIIKTALAEEDIKEIYKYTYKKNLGKFKPKNIMTTWKNDLRLF